MLAFWDGDKWQFVPSQAVFGSSGEILLTANLKHFTIYAVLYGSDLKLRDPGFLPVQPTYSDSRISFAVFEGGTLAELNRALVRVKATGAWVQNSDGQFALWIVNGPEFIQRDFTALMKDPLPVIAMTLTGA